MKKLIALICAVCILLTFAGCGGQAVEKIPTLTLEKVKGDDGVEVVQRKSPTGSYEDTLDGLLKFMSDGGVIPASMIEGEDKSGVTQMSYKEIGATDGYRFKFTYNKATVQAEFYSFDPDNLDQKGSECLGSTQLTGSFEILGKTVKASASSGGKYIMIYTDPNAEKNSENGAQRDWAEELFLKFKG